LAPTPSGKTASKEYFSKREYGVAASPRVVAANEAVPSGGGRYQVGKPYKVKGKTYRPKEDPNYSKVGYASWYGSAFHGRQTANGEIYDMGQLTAAHPTLPLPSYVRVTNVANGRSVVVRVNDRGPFKKGRIIDVSAAVAEMLDFKRAGTAKVKVEYVGRARMDGRDRQMLLASYDGPNDFGRNALFASNVTSKPKNLMVAALAPLRKRQSADSTPGPDRSTDLFGAQRLDGAPVTAPAFVPAASSGSDPIGGFILGNGFVNSYAPTDRFSRAHLAADAMARGGKASVTVQIGSFGDKGNAERVAATLTRFGRAEIGDRSTSGRRLYVVRVLVDSGTVSPQSVLTAAAAIGLNDAFVVSR
jgi:rare lipoprotein A